MKLLVTGGTGFIGEPLSQALAERNHTVTIVTRTRFQTTAALHKNKTLVTWDENGGNAWKKALQDSEAVINLAGESIAERRWTAEQKLKIRNSRIETTRALINAMEALHARPKVFISASAVGYYGACGDEPLTESAQAGTGFLAEVCKLWEKEASEAETFVERTLRLRFGMVLGKDGGALDKMVPPFKMYLGGALGHGRQWVPWIHMADVIGLILFLLEQPRTIGPVNITAPNPERMRDFCAGLGRVLRRPSWAPMPAPVLRLMLGEMADMLLTGQRVIPEVAQKLGYKFKYPTLSEALTDCLA
ncbi:MAG: TIGR01777 family protein [Acidobacteria bacterium]|nr:TIGR01777 family protein [Acidobacteriota bacterium]MBI3655749.1 TIGR01777 family protein [Acidobacteriota bacterium]